MCNSCSDRPKMFERKTVTSNREARDAVLNAYPAWRLVYVELVPRTPLANNLGCDYRFFFEREV